MREVSATPVPKLTHLNLISCNQLMLGVGCQWEARPECSVGVKQPGQGLCQGVLRWTKYSWSWTARQPALKRGGRCPGDC